uniref:Glycosyltransferase n=1 Tax=viral metagenome TaxID=1070528 RepID=A0A6M3JB92_9ZZZZ
MWSPGAWQKTVDMVVKSNKVGVCTWLHEMVDINAGIPYAHLNMMRDTACMYAHDTGFEWVLLIENDALPDEDMLIKLLNWDMPVVVPYIVDEVLDRPICSPYYKKGSGLQPVMWSVFTCMLINTKVLNCFPFAQPFDTVGIESGLFHKLRHFGHKVYQDTNTELKIAKRPAYPVDHGGLEAEWKVWVELDKKRRQIPDRRPIDPEDKRQVNGIYMPLEGAFPEEKPARGGEPPSNLGSLKTP